jgi:hypothetical protein
MKTTATALLIAFGLLALCALAEIIGALLAPLGALIPLGICALLIRYIHRTK